MRYEPQDVFSAGNRVVVRSLMSGTHTGEFMGHPATGKRFTYQQIHIFRVNDGKVAEHWANRDDVGLFQQLGLH